MTRALLDALLAARRAKRPLAVATDLESGAQWAIDPADALPDGLPPELEGAAREALRSDRAATLEAGGRALFVNPFNPPLRLVLVGAVHIAQPLARAAALAGFVVTVVDPRRAFGATLRFPGVELVAKWPGEGLAELAPDARTAVVTLTHDPKLDDAALAVALRSSAFYVGSLGSRKTHAKRVDRLRAAGFEAAEIARIRGPVGLAIGARTPAEIAISILADVIAHLRQAA